MGAFISRATRERSSRSRSLLRTGSFGERAHGSRVRDHEEAIRAIIPIPRSGRASRARAGPRCCGTCGAGRRRIITQANRRGGSAPILGPAEVESEIPMRTSVQVSQRGRLTAVGATSLHEAPRSPARQADPHRQIETSERCAQAARSGESAGGPLGIDPTLEKSDIKRARAGGATPRRPERPASRCFGARCTPTSVPCAATPDDGEISLRVRAADRGVRRVMAAMRAGITRVRFRAQPRDFEEIHAEGGEKLDLLAADGRRRGRRGARGCAGPRRRKFSPASAKQSPRPATPSASYERAASAKFGRLDRRARALLQRVCS